MGEKSHRNITSDAYRRSEGKCSVQQQKCSEDVRTAQSSPQCLSRIVPRPDSLQRSPLTQVRFVIQ